MKPVERAVAGQRDEPLEPDALLDLGALGRRALVVPEDRRAQDASVARRGTTRPCIWPESPIGGDSAPSRASAASAARHQSSGSCSAQPGCGVESP